MHGAEPHSPGRAGLEMRKQLRIDNPLPLALDATAVPNHDIEEDRGCEAEEPPRAQEVKRTQVRHDAPS